MVPGESPALPGEGNGKLPLPSWASYAPVTLAFFGALLLLAMGLQREQPILPVLALAAPVAVALLLLDEFTLIRVGVGILPWAIFINLGDGLPVLSFYVFSGLAALKIALRPGRKSVSPTLVVLALYGIFLAASAFLLGNLGVTISKLFHWFNFMVFYFALYNTAVSLDKVRSLLAVLVCSLFGNALFSIGLYLVANFVFPTPSSFVDSVLFPFGKLIYGTRGFELILLGTNWFSEEGVLKAMGFMYNPTQASLVALMSFGLSAFLLLDGEAMVNRRLLYFNIGAALIHLTLTSGRSGLATFPLLMAIWLYALMRNRGVKLAAKNILILLLTLGLVGALVGNVLWMNFNTLFSLNYYSNAGRLIAMTSGLTVATFAGLFGFGFGNTPTVLEMGSPSTWLQQKVNSVIGDVSYSFKSIIADEYYRQTNYHSLYLDQVVQTGIIGFVLFVAVFARLAYPGKAGKTALGYGNLALMLAFFASQAVGNDLFYPKVMLYLLTLSCLVESLAKRPPPEAASP